MNEQTKCPKCGAEKKNATLHRNGIRYANLESQLTAANKRIEELEKVPEPITNCVGNEIRMTTNNTDQVFYNFVPIGLISQASRVLKGEGEL